MGKVSSHQSVTGVRITRHKRLKNGFMISLSQRDASRTECARVSIETQERPDISVQEVDQAAISAGKGNLIVKVKVMPLAVHFREFICRGVFLPQQRPSQLLNSLVS